jgi:hypothetical protein
VEVDQGVPSCKIVNNPHSALAAVVLGAGTTNMMPRSLPTRRRLQMLALVIATAYATILLYQAIVPRQVIRAIIIVVIPIAILHRVLPRVTFIVLPVSPCQ